MKQALTDEQRALLPTDEEVAFYREHGWHISKKILPDELIDAAVRGADRFYAGERDRDLPLPFPRGWTPDKGEVLRKNDYSSLRIGALWALVSYPLIAAIASRLSGSPAIRLWHDQLLYKPPEKPGAPLNVGWHTDRGYWKTCSSSDMLTAWVPFHDCDEPIGTITFIDGSHRWPDNTRNLSFFDSDLEALEKKFNTGGQPVVKTPARLRKGCVSFHHCLTIHGSGPNRTDRPRRSIAIHLQDAGNRWQEARRADGTLITHDNDRLCRQVNGHPDYTDPVICPVLWPPQQ
jgi:hypothetical protein